jgi:hypothetical protein
MPLQRKRAATVRSSPTEPIKAPVVPVDLNPPVPRAPEDIPEELIAARAYELWQRRGQPADNREQDWFAARNELEQERLNWAAPTDDDRDR